MVLSSNLYCWEVTGGNGGVDRWSWVRIIRLFGGQWWCRAWLWVCEFDSLTFGDHW
jgi:hypothetical protein